MVLWFHRIKSSLLTFATCNVTLLHTANRAKQILVVFFSLPVNRSKGRREAEVILVLIQLSLSDATPCSMRDFKDVCGEAHDGR